MILRSFTAMEKKHWSHAQYSGYCVESGFLWVFCMGHAEGLQGLSWILKNHITMASTRRETTRGVLVGALRKLSGRVFSRRLGLCYTGWGFISC
jgi:hypothetical protein